MISSMKSSLKLSLWGINEDIDRIAIVVLVARRIATLGVNIHPIRGKRLVRNVNESTRDDLGLNVKGSTSAIVWIRLGSVSVS